MRAQTKTPVVGATSVKIDRRVGARRPTLEDVKNTEPRSTLQAVVSVFDSVTETQPSESITLSEGLNRIQGGHYRTRVERLRVISDEAHESRNRRSKVGEKSSSERKYESLKRILPAVTWSGQFTERRSDGLQKHSGVLCLDVDHLSKQDVDELRDSLRLDPNILFFFRSPSHHGLKIGVRIEPERHAESWEAIAHYFRDCYGVEIDPACKDVPRLCFVSYDPELFLNRDAQLFWISLPLVLNSRLSVSRTEVEELLAHVPTRPDYDTWIRVIAAVGDVLPDSEAIEVLSNWSPEERPGEYAAKLRNRLRYVRFGTLRYLARRNGWKPEPAGKPDPVLKSENSPVRSSGLVTRRASEYKPRATEWLWPGFIPYGHFTICEGDPGIGKSTLLNGDLPARLSTGRSIDGNEEETQPHDAILFNAEDDPADTIAPRLIAAEAKMNRIHILDGVNDSNGKRRAADLSRDIELLSERIRSTNAKLVVIDPLNAYLGSNTDSYKDSSVRQVLSPLAALAQKTGAAIIGIRHCGKGVHGKPVHRGLGSIGYAAAARSVLQFAVDPNARESGTVIVAVAKSNLGRFPKSKMFRLQSCEILSESGTAIQTSRIEWLGESELTADDLSTVTITGEERTAVDEAVQLIRTEIVAHGGKAPAKHITKTASECGISQATLNRAKRRLNVKSDRIGSPSDAAAMWVWQLPDRER